MDGGQNKRINFEFINLFRAFAAFWVLSAHAQIWCGYHFIQIPSPKIAVDLFMIISGFLMADTAGGRWKTEPLDVPRSRISFWARRFFRIAPAYYLAIIVAFIGAPIFADGSTELQRLNMWTPGNAYDPLHWSFSATSIFVHITFLFGLLPRYVDAIPLPDWSLSLEMQFYLAFPVIILCLRRFGPLVGGLALAVMALIVGQTYASLVHFDEPSLLLFKLQYFIAGMLLFSALDRQLPRVKRYLYVAAGSILTGIAEGYGLHRFDITFLFIAMFLLGMMECHDLMPARVASVLRSRVIQFASNVSYSVYLFHNFFIELCGYVLSRSPALVNMSKQDRTAWIFLVTLIGAYTTATVVHRLVELPGINLGKRVTRWINEQNTRRTGATISIT